VRGVIPSSIPGVPLPALLGQEVKVKFINGVDIDLDTDLELIRAAAEGKLDSISRHKPGLPSTVRIYLLAPPCAPIVVFDEAPADFYITAIVNRALPFDDGTDPRILKIAALSGNECLGVDWISIPVAIWMTALMHRFLVTDLRFLDTRVKEFFLSKVRPPV